MRAATWSICCFLLLAGCDVPDFAIWNRTTFTAQPDALGVCAANAIIRLSWDARSSGEQNVAIFVGQGDAEKLFAHGGSEGSQETGPWVQPNTVFTLRSRDNRKELARLTVGSKNCGPVTFNAQPAALSACTSNAVVRLSWDARSSGEQSVAIFIGERDKEKLLAQGGPEGSQETGPWVGPNTVFTLKSRDSLRELARLTVDSKDCGPATFNAQPAALSACTSNAVVRLSWDARSSGEQSVALFIGERDKERLFAEGGPEGFQETGPWIQPNTVFTLRSRDGHRELARLTVGSKDCGPATFKAQPAALSACTPGAIVRLSWDARGSGDQGVALFARLRDGERLFAQGGPEGYQDTGPWVRPNTVFTLRSRDGSREIASLTVGLESCDPAGKNRRLGAG